MSRAVPPIYQHLNTLLGKSMESVAQWVTALRFELRPQFREAIRVRVGSYSWKCVVWMSREVSVLLCSERAFGLPKKGAAYDLVRD